MRRRDRSQRTFRVPPVGIPRNFDSVCHKIGGFSAHEELGQPSIVTRRDTCSALDARAAPESNDQCGCAHTGPSHAKCLVFLAKGRLRAFNLRLTICPTVASRNMRAGDIHNCRAVPIFVDERIRGPTFPLGKRTRNVVEQRAKACHVGRRRSIRYNFEALRISTSNGALIIKE